MLYLISPVSSEVFISLIGNLSVHPIQRVRLVDGLIALLKQEGPKDNFPPH